MAESFTEITDRVFQRWLGERQRFVAERCVVISVHRSWLCRVGLHRWRIGAWSAQPLGWAAWQTCSRCPAERTRTEARAPLLCRWGWHLWRIQEATASRFGGAFRGWWVKGRCLRCLQENSWPDLVQAGPAQEPER